MSYKLPPFLTNPLQQPKETPHQSICWQGSLVQTKSIKCRATYQTTDHEYLDIKVIPAARDMTSTLTLLPETTLSRSQIQLAYTQKCSSCMKPVLLVQDLFWQTHLIKSVQEHDLFEWLQLFAFFQIRYALPLEQTLTHASLPLWYRDKTWTVFFNPHKPLAGYVF